MFKKLLGLGKKDSEPSILSRKLSPGIKDTILSIVGQRAIPVMPGAAQKAFALASNPKAEARDFVEVIEVDEALSARVIKIANSVFFDRGNKSSTIDDAVLVIGLNELRNLLNANALCDIFPSSHPLRIQLWAHDIAVALISKQLAKRFLPSNEDSAFLAGLMHDIGKLLLLQRTTPSYEKVLKSIEYDGIEFKDAEIQEYPFDHTEVGQLIAERWNFSEELLEVISNHHNPKVLDPSPITLTKIVCSADIIAHSLGLGLSSKFTRLRSRYNEKLPQLWKSLGIPESEAASILDQAKRNFETEYDLYSGGFGK